MSRRRRRLIGGFSPYALSGLTVWTDAQSTDLGIVPLWVDKSGYGNNALQSNASYQPINTANQINTKQALVLDGSNDYMATAAFAGGNLTISTMFFVAKRAVSGVGSAGMYLADGIDSSNRQAILSTDTTQILWSFAGGGVNTSTVADTATHIHCCTFAGDASSTYYLDGINIGTANIGSNQLAGLTIGARYNLIQFLNGIIGEVIIYNRVLSATEITQINNYLANKWWNTPLTVSGLKLWLDAADTGLGKVSAWNDKSGLLNNALQATAANQPTNTANQINGLPALVFDDSSYMSITSNAGLSWASNCTVFFVGDTSTISAAVRRFMSKSGAVAFGKDLSSGARFTTLTVQDYDGNSGFFAVNTPLVACYTFGSYDASFYKNGILDSTVSGASPAVTNSNALLISSTGEPWNGKMAEIIAYNKLLSSTERDTITQYLKSKWGIA